MDNLYARCVFFVRDAERALDFYVNALGFKVDWNHQVDGKAYVFQVSLFGFELILNQVDAETAERPGHGRVFIGLEDHQAEQFRQHLREKAISTTMTQWGNPTLVITDQDRNELYFWLPGVTLPAD